MSTFRSALRVAWRHPVYLVSYLAILSLMSVLVGRLVADQAAAVPSSYARPRKRRRGGRGRLRSLPRVCLLGGRPL